MRCSPVSEGCANCWHLKFAKRHSCNPKFSEECRKAYAGGSPVLKEKELMSPLKLKKPSRIGVQFMGDLFHEDLDPLLYSKIFRTIRSSPQHIFIILTKRPKMMKIILGKCENFYKNIWLGISAENQKMFDERWAYLKQIPAAVYMVSYEPALVPLVLPPDFLELGQRAFLVCGGESGPGARPLRPDWARGVRDQCVEAGVPYFFKQFGAWEACKQVKHIRCTCMNNAEWIGMDGKIYDIPRDNGGVWMRKVGKKAAGRELDGKTWSQVPGDKNPCLT